MSAALTSLGGCDARRHLQTPASTAIAQAVGTRRKRNTRKRKGSAYMSLRFQADGSFDVVVADAHRSYEHA